MVHITDTRAQKIG